jgi:8-oxo-dGTP pyrophosphatase MutT (NUDIX family)
MKEVSAGILIIYNNKLLLIHPTNSSWHGSYGFPKGRLDNSESPLDAAIRETEEEVGITIPVKMINKSAYTLSYSFNKKGTKIYKTTYYFICKIDNLSDIGLDKEVIPKSQLQLAEVDWAGFVDYKEAKKRLGRAFQPLLQHYNQNESMGNNLPIALPVSGTMKYIETYEEFINKLKDDE